MKMGIIHVTIQIVPTDMICRVENMEKRDKWTQGRELKMGIIYVTIQIVPSDMVDHVDKRDENGTRIENGNNSCYNTIQIVPTDMICRVEYVDNRDERDHGDEN